MIRYMIIEDEYILGHRLERMISKIRPSWTLSCRTAGVEESVEALRSHEVDLIFMDMTSYEQIQMPADATSGKSDFLKDGQQCRVLLYKGNPLDIDIPMSLVLEVVETEPGAKGDTVSNVTKAAKLESGAVVQVPLFVNEGDKIKVNTETREYLGRE